MLVEISVLACGLSALNAWSSVPAVVAVEDGHDALLERFDSTCDSPKVAKVSEYLASYVYSKPLTLRGLLVALAMQKLRFSRALQLLALVILGLVPFLGRFVLATRSPAELVEKYFEYFIGATSIGIYSSLADLVHHLQIRKAHEPDACERMTTCQHLHSSTEVLTINDIKPPSNAAPCILKYETPEPFLPSLLPRLCMGWGGLDPMQTTHVSIVNRMVAELLNRLANNLLVDSSLSTQQSFAFDNSNIHTVHDFVTKLPGVSVSYSRNSSSFGAMLCLKDEQGLGKYQQLPVAFPGRTCLRDPETGKQLSVLSYHSSVIIEGDEEICPLGRFRVQCYLGPDGWTGWKHGDEYIRPWAPLLKCRSALTENEIKQTCQATTVVACAVNLASKMQNLTVGGYALHGTCVDTTALCKAVALGVSEDFPLIVSGDARAGVLVACAKIAEGLPPQHWSRGTLEQVRNVVLNKLPDDASIPPKEMIETLGRFENSLLGDFVFNDKLREELKEVKQKWEKILELNACS